MSSPSEVLVFGPFRLEVARRELIAHGVPVSLGQRAFDVLLALVNRRGELVTKDELDGRGLARRRGGGEQPSGPRVRAAQGAGLGRRWRALSADGRRPRLSLRRTGGPRRRGRGDLRAERICTLDAGGGPGRGVPQSAAAAHHLDRPGSRARRGRHPSRQPPAGDAGGLGRRRQDAAGDRSRQPSHRRLRGRGLARRARTARRPAAGHGDHRRRSRRQLAATAAAVGTVAAAVENMASPV